MIRFAVDVIDNRFVVSGNMLVVVCFTTWMFVLTGIIHFFMTLFIVWSLLSWIRPLDSFISIFLDFFYLQPYILAMSFVIVCSLTPNIDFIIHHNGHCFLGKTCFDNQFLTVMGFLVVDYVLKSTHLCVLLINCLHQYFPNMDLVIHNWLLNIVSDIGTWDFYYPILLVSSLLTSFIYYHFNDIIFMEDGCSQLTEDAAALPPFYSA